MARELVLAPKNVAQRSNSSYVCMGTTHTCALVQYISCIERDGALNPTVSSNSPLNSVPTLRSYPNPRSPAGSLVTADIKKSIWDGCEWLIRCAIQLIPASLNIVFILVYA